MRARKAYSGYFDSTHIEPIPLVEEEYGIVSVKPVEPPRGTVGTGWYCFIIGHGKNDIRGYRQGSIDTVTRAVEEMVFRLNERRRGKFGRVHLTMSSQGNKDKRQ